MNLKSIKNQSYLFLFLIIQVSCNAQESKIVVNNVDDIKPNFIDKSLNKVKTFKIVVNKKPLISRDTLFTSEGVEWEGLALYYEDVMVLLMETSWLDRTKIIRATIYDSLIKTSEGLAVGKSYADLKSYISFDSWKDFPDGYVMFRGKGNNYVYSMNIDEYPSLFEGSITHDSIPQELKIQSITVD